ncbi:hypothetical protein AB5I39_17475 [Sphingomonas sp. MMS24-J45]|uniref:hypothetical protein n=1 Tax=Sphingomonas sp. MMS24-J45 TaxID=3238806 RepID=UPI00384A9F52
MAGPIGATSGKFVLIGATLLLNGRVNDIPVRLAIVPGASTSAISPDLSARLAARRGGGDVSIHLRAETFRARVESIEGQPSTGAAIRLGQDVLDENPIEIDFAHQRVRPLSPSEATRFERRAQPIALHHEPDGSVSVDLAGGTGTPVSARLDLSRAVGVTMHGLNAGSAVKVGGVALPKVEVSDGPKPVVGLYALRHVRVIFDLGHDRIWVHR